MFTSLFRSNPRRIRQILAWSVAGLDILLAAACALLYALNRGDMLALLSTLVFSLLPISGAVILARQPHNLVGWLAAAIGYFFVGGDVLSQYGVYTLITRPGVLPFGGLAVWIASWSWTIVFSMAALFLLLIPDGRFLTRRWRNMFWVAFATSLPVIVIMGIFSAPIDKLVLLKSQLYNTPLDWPGSLLIIKIIEIWQPVQFIWILLAAISLFIRFRRSEGVERQQLKWFFLALITIPLAIGLGFITGIFNSPLLNDVYQAVNLVSAFAFPVGLALAVTRYRLYEIDVIIRRTLVYSLLTIVLALIYLSSVILLQEIFTLLTGQHSTASIIISTLIIVALFSPFRQGIQAWIDRRFYRAKYNTEQMLERFASRQREIVDLEGFTAQLQGVVEETLHPEYISLFLIKASKIRQKPD